jgi:N-ethylmaleimide reductase
MREPLGASTLRDRDRPPIAPLIRKAFARTLILNSDFTLELAEATVAEGKADAITFGRPFIANPDLPRGIAKALPLATVVVATFYSRGSEGYVDYPFADVAIPDSCSSYSPVDDAQQLVDLLVRVAPEGGGRDGDADHD